MAENTDNHLGRGDGTHHIRRPLQFSDPAATPNPYSQEAIFGFTRALAGVFIHELHMEPDSVEALVEEFSHLLRQHQGRAFEGIRRRLTETGIRAKWNHVLANQRPICLESWIRSYCREETLDLLCGDGKVGEALARAGILVTLTERTGAYSMTRAHSVPFTAFEGLKDDAQGIFHTIILCTVLHHEHDPHELWHYALSLRPGRLIVIENCLDNDHGAEFHLLLDLFFCRCLNDFDLPAEGQHETRDAWISMLSTGGEVIAAEHRPSLPGIPLPHDLFVVDTKRGNGRVNRAVAKLPLPLG